MQSRGVANKAAKLKSTFLTKLDLADYNVGNILYEVLSGFYKRLSMIEMKVTS